MATAKSGSIKNQNAELKELQAKIKELERQNEQLKGMQYKAKKKAPRRTILRGFGVTFFVTLSIVTFMLFNISSWVKATVLDTDGFLETTQPLIDQPAVQEALQREITNRLFENIDVESELAEALPENVAFLAGPLSSQVESFTYNKIGDVLRSEQIEAVWDTTLESVHTVLISYINNENADGVLSVNEIYSFAGDKLQDTNVSFLLNKQLPDKVGQITLAEITWLDDARAYVGYIEKLPVVFLLVSLLSAMLAVIISLQKKQVVVTLFILMFTIMAATLIAINIGEQLTMDQVRAENSAAASEIYTVVTQPLYDRTTGYLALSGFVLLIFFATSGLQYVVASRKFLSHQLERMIYRITPQFDVPEWFNWVNKNTHVMLWTAFMTIFVAFGVRIPPEYNQLLSSFITASIITFLLYILSIVLRAAKQAK